LFLDEPTTGLDPRSRVELWTLIRELVTAGTTILLTTQYLEEADQLAERIAVIHDGRIVADDTTAALKQRLGSDRLVLTLPHGANVERARALLAREGPEWLAPGQRSVSGGDGSLHADHGARQVTVGIQHPEQLRLTLDCLHRAGITVQAVDLRAPTLDDVFFALTEAVA
jgi:ABC-2 type transport system ATP-binding protein